MDTQEYEQAYVAWFPATKNLMLSRGARFHEAEEIAQAAWAHGWELRHQIKDPGKVNVWVNIIALNFRRYAFRKPQAEAVDSKSPVPKVWMREDDRIDLWRLLAGCSEEDLSIFQLRVEGYEFGEIAQKIGGVTARALRLRYMKRLDLCAAMLGISRQKSKAKARRGCKRAKGGGE